ncbi:MAG: hypothetical protein JKY31_08070 [Rhodobacteraceae bacterium]|nr:hypothetical protein [Paracoccaceae bacterium]
MANTFHWVTDPNSDIIETASKSLKIRDAYTQWVFGWGRDFIASEAFSKGNPADFSYYVNSKSLTRAGRPKPFLRGASTQVFKKSKMVSILPITAKSIAAGPIQQAAHVQFDPHIDPGKLVIVGVIDDGVNIFNQRFRPQGHPTRVDYAWVQDGPAPTSDPTVAFGCELTCKQITGALDNDGLSETELMGKYGLRGAINGTYLPSVFTHSSNHGTQIADLAAGAKPDLAAMANTRLITVQLPALAVTDTSGASLISALHTAAIYVFDRARVMSAHYLRPIPVVLNISFGLTSGPRNGQHFLERALRALSIKYREDMKTVFGKNAVPPVVRVISAGNENVSVTHAASHNPVDPFNLPVRLQPEDQTPSFLEVWLPQSTTKAAIAITLPDGTTGAFNFDQMVSKTPTDFAARILTPLTGPNNPICRVTLDAPFGAGKKNSSKDQLFWRLVVAFAPTSSPATSRLSASFGLWDVSVTAENATGNMHAWILRDGPVSGFATQGRQAYFDDDHLGDASYTGSAFDRYDDIAVDDKTPRSSVISRDGNISGLATSARLKGKYRKSDSTAMDTVSVGACRWDQPSAAIYSAADLDRPAGEQSQAPMVMAVTETSRVMPDIRASGILSDTSSVLNGTSAAAPIVTRVLAAYLSELSQDQYSAFDPNTVLKLAGNAANRPTGTEITSSAGIRVNRLREGGVIVNTPNTLIANVSRDGIAKT